MIGQLYSTAESPAGSLAWRVKTRQLEAARHLGGCLGGIVIAAVFLIAVADAFGLLISITDSAAPSGVYRVSGHKIERGELVAACLPISVAQQGLALGYLRTGSCPGNAEPVDKIIGALPGDVVEVERTGVSVNGLRFGRSTVAELDSAGRPLRHVPFGEYQVSTNQVWLFGFNDRRSWDSRYFGPIPLANMRGRLEAVFTW
jgi:conjugative transfer signal peptidase TraF